MGFFGAEGNGFEAGLEFLIPKGYILEACERGWNLDRIYRIGRIKRDLTGLQKRGWWNVVRIGWTVLFGKNPLIWKIL